jgi:hypothetical protein
MGRPHAHDSSQRFAREEIETSCGRFVNLDRITTYEGFRPPLAGNSGIREIFFSNSRWMPRLVVYETWRWIQQWPEI